LILPSGGRKSKETGATLAACGERTFHGLGSRRGGVDPAVQPHSLMTDVLGVGVRRLPPA